MVRLSVNIVTFNSAKVIRDCLDSLNKQTFRHFTTHILDNASADETIALTGVFPVDVIRSQTNSGFCRAHNRLIQSFPAEYILVLNPDTILRPTFIEELVRALDADPEAGSATGKLRRFDGLTLDTTGVIMLRSQRHLDRGADEKDRGQFDRAGEVFGASGCAAMYRMKALEDCAIGGQFFDEDFFAFREDADLAWRLRLFGWKCLYVPQAFGFHQRRVTPERRANLPPEINYHSVKNRFLLRINNMTLKLYLRDFIPITIRDLSVIGYTLLRERTSLPAFSFLFRNRARLWRKRQTIQSRKRAASIEISKWFH